MEAAPMLAVAQIVEGEATCTYCDAPATMTSATGADPEPEPVCGKHGREFIAATDWFAERHLS